MFPPGSLKKQALQTGSTGLESYERGQAALSNSPLKGQGKPRPLQLPHPWRGRTTPSKPPHPSTVAAPDRDRGLSLSDLLFCTRHSGVKDIAAPPIFSQRHEGAVRKSVPPLAGSTGR